MAGALEQTDPLQDFLRAQPVFVRELMAGGLAGAAAKTAVAPLERTKILMQVACLRASVSSP